MIAKSNYEEDIMQMSLHKWHEIKTAYYTNTSYGIHPEM